MPLRAGQRLGPYEILSPLGSGGMGEVYRARDIRLGREVALKVLPAEVASDPARRQRFEQEARAASALNHPNIVSTYDVGAEGGIAFIVSELVDGATLRASIRRGPVPVASCSILPPRWRTAWPPPMRQAFCTATRSQKISC